MDYDVIIVGASFAGLTIASQLQGRVLVIDKKPIGAGQTSACCTPEWVLKRINCTNLIRQSMTYFVVHSRGEAITYPIASPFCTFDYAPLCQQLWRQSRATFLQARVLGLRDQHRV
ncbi:MAG: NAD(P)/FAD-dependent oxidoreductase, partial [Chloroflexi bacterium]